MIVIAIIGGDKMKYEAGIGFVLRRTAKALAKKLEGHGDVLTAKKSLPNSGINTFVANCDEEGKKIVEKYFEKWEIGSQINWDDK